MPEWLKNLIISIGGGTVVLVGVLTIFKTLFIKLFETGIEKSFEKNLEKYRNKLSRTTKAYEILLDKEIAFYEKLDPLIAELVPLIQDLPHYLTESNYLERKEQKEKYKKTFLRYIEIAKEIKSIVLTYQAYITQDIFVKVSTIVADMQVELEFWMDEAELLFKENYDDIDYTAAKVKADRLLKCMSSAELEIKKRLKELSEIE